MCVTIQLKSRSDWLIFFHRAKTVDTLDIMLDAALKKLHSPIEQADAIWGQEDRLDEIEEFNKG
ncbi:hypothetical protein [Enterovibrio coralii]|uniref:Uncharacterized protein n=1 Tax=Enterovibrio coralii TaxID=294935 RepID=A0A135I502_9GAMM|nr:hypothetical protein [Enterovibrio coralii]KXF80507.1 hypothetical protein ATN88_07400 [Enterovibrio coralii]